ncbi:hypothetical protein FOA52_000045 [Chlamydomonas sp. UWO 241]|nr:hypothetical protein FOA52_000045 [Chlamydomonas sp. UWO 241]
MKRLGGTSGSREPTIAPVPGTTLGLLNVPGLPLGPKQRAFDTPGVPHDYQLTSMLNLTEVKGVEERIAKHVGTQLTPPYSPERAAEFPRLVPAEVAVQGSAWDASTVDVAIAGLGWVSVGCKGAADLRVWTFPKVAVTTRAALVPDFAREFERPGFSTLLPNAGGGGAGGGAAKAPPVMTGSEAATCCPSQWQPPPGSSQTIISSEFNDDAVGAASAAAERLAFNAEAGISLPFCLAMDVVRFLYEASPKRAG